MNIKELISEAEEEIEIFDRPSRLTSVAMIEMLKQQVDKIAELEKDNDELELDTLKRMRVVSELEKELFKQSQESKDAVLRAIEIILEKDDKIAELEKEQDFVLSKVGFDGRGFYLPCGNSCADKEDSIKSIKEALKE
jgi:hypothetical protein